MKVTSHLRHLLEVLDEHGPEAALEKIPSNAMGPVEGTAV